MVESIIGLFIKTLNDGGDFFTLIFKSSFPDPYHYREPHKGIIISSDATVDLPNFGDIPSDKVFYEWFHIDLPSF